MPLRFVAFVCYVGGPVPAGMFAEDQLERLQTFPDIGRDDLIRYFTLTPADVAFLDPGRVRGPADRLGLAAALATLDVEAELAKLGPVGWRPLRRRLALLIFRDRPGEPPQGVAAGPPMPWWAAGS